MVLKQLGVVQGKTIELERETGLPVDVEISCDTVAAEALIEERRRVRGAFIQGEEFDTPRAKLA